MKFQFASTVRHLNGDVHLSPLEAETSAHTATPNMILGSFSKKRPEGPEGPREFDCFCLFEKTTSSQYQVLGAIVPKLRCGIRLLGQGVLSLVTRSYGHTVSRAWNWCEHEVRGQTWRNSDNSRFILGGQWPETGFLIIPHPQR